MRTWILALVVSGAAIAHGDPDEKIVEAYQLPEGLAYRDFRVARSIGTTPDEHRGALILERCNSERCNVKRISLYPSETVYVLGLVDLAGATGPFLDRIVWEGHPPLTTPARMIHPALVVRHGSEQSDVITVLSLERGRVEPTVFSIVVRARLGGGAGQMTSLRFERTGSTKMLSIISTEELRSGDRRACLPPTPVETRWHFEGERYVASALVPDDRRGC